jgi:plasmid stabilization system protein ParE
MVKMGVFWTKFAFNSLKEIHKYYKENVSQTVADNIRDNILASTAQLEIHPKSGTIEELLSEIKENHRFIVRGNYKIIYKTKDKRIFITDVFDTRQNPVKIKKTSDDE